jgi:hypothetical protein
MRKQLLNYARSAADIAQHVAFLLTTCPTNVLTAGNLGKIFRRNCKAPRNGSVLSGHMSEDSTRWQVHECPRRVVGALLLMFVIGGL